MQQLRIIPQGRLLRGRTKTAVNGNGSLCVADVAIFPVTTQTTRQHVVISE